MAETLYYKGDIGKEDIRFGNSTFNRRNSQLAYREITEINDSHLPLSEQTTKFLSDLFDAGYDVDIYPRTIVPKSSADEVMTTNEEFEADDGHVFWRDPGGANRNFNPTGTFVRGHEIILINTADAAETIVFDSTSLAQNVGQNERGIFRYNGATWSLVNLYVPASTTSLEFSNSFSADHAFNGIYTNETVGEDVTFGEVLYLNSNGSLYLADADASTTMPVVGIATEAISSTGAGDILRQGYIRDDSWAWTVGGLIYASTTAGGLTQTKPTGSGDQVQIVGYAYSADIMFQP